MDITNTLFLHHLITIDLSILCMYKFFQENNYNIDFLHYLDNTTLTDNWLLRTIPKPSPQNFHIHQFFYFQYYNSLIRMIHLIV